MTWLDGDASWVQQNVAFVSRSLSRKSAAPSALCDGERSNQVAEYVIFNEPGPHWVVFDFQEEFCVTKEDGGNDAWWWSNMAIVTSEEVCD